MGEAEIDVDQRQGDADHCDDASAHDERRAHGSLQQCGEEREERDHERCEDGEAEPEADAEIRIAAGQENVGEDREDPEEVHRSEIAARRLQPEQPDHAEGEQSEEDIDPPALRDRVGAVDEVVQLVPDEGPAGAALAAAGIGAAGRPVGAGPDRIDDEKLQERRNDDVEEVEHHQRQDRVEGAGKEVFPNPGDGAAGQIGRRQRIHLLGADETGHIDGGAHRISYRSMIATRRL